MSALEVGPSYWFEDVRMCANKLLKNEGLAVAPVLVVEGNQDHDILQKFCVYGSRQVVIVDGRSNVEGVLRIFRDERPERIEIAGLTDCDGLGKVSDLIADPALVVTQGCDAEADMFLVGAVAAALRSAGVNDVAQLVDGALELALPMSLLRRKAAAFGAPMKMPGKRGAPRKARLQFAAVDSDLLSTIPSLQLDQAVEALAIACSEILDWGEDLLSGVLQQELEVPATFEMVGSGKDAFDAILILGRDIAALEGWTSEALYASAGRELGLETLKTWDVGRRLVSWQKAAQVALLRSSD